MAPTSEVLADMADLRDQLRQQGSPYSELFKLRPARVLLDIAFDWTLMVGAVAAVVWLDVMLAPLSVLVLANRQRALGNILHDAGHRNIFRDKDRNDFVARGLVAPLLFAIAAVVMLWSGAFFFASWGVGPWRAAPHPPLPLIHDDPR